MKTIYHLGIGKAEYQTDSEFEAWTIRNFLESLNKQGECGFWEKKTTEGEGLDLAKAYIEYAQEHLGRDGELEIDDVATVSFSDDGGAYVQAWVWVDQSDVLPQEVEAE